MNMLPRLKPRTFYDLVIEVAIVRPGPIQGDMVHPYLRRRCGDEPVEFPSPHPEHGPADELRQVLGKTMGVPLFQEQAMRLAMVAAKFTGPEANELRRAMATFRRRGTIDTLHQKMVGRMTARGYPAEFAERCFNQIKGFGEYGFPESHAASFAHLVYVSAWIKCHYPAAFAASLLNSQPMGFYAPAQIVRCAREHGVEAREADVNLSLWDCTLEPVYPAPPARGRVAMIKGHRRVMLRTPSLHPTSQPPSPAGGWRERSRCAWDCARSTDCAKTTCSASSRYAMAFPPTSTRICLLRLYFPPPERGRVAMAFGHRRVEVTWSSRQLQLTPSPTLPLAGRGSSSPTCATCGAAAG